MKRQIIVIILLLTLLFSGCTHKITETSVLSAEKANMMRDILCIMMAYPGYVSGIEKGDDGYVYIVMKSGKKVIYDDLKSKTFEQKMAKADIQDMLDKLYPLYDINELMPLDFDPGRCRVYPLLKDVYGNFEQNVRSNLISVKTDKGSFMFNKNNDAAKSLKEALNELSYISKNDRRVLAALYPSSGTFNYRNISGTNLLSPHAFGIAIDLARDQRDYWQWTNREQGLKRLKSYPREIVKVFEKHNFIWGGKWGHFDILHFEYRPEIIYKSRCFSSSRDGKQPWYGGAPENQQVRNYIEIIENALN